MNATKPFPEEVSDPDFDTAIRIIFHCLDHTLVVSSLLKENETVKTISNPLISEQLLAGLAEKFTLRDALEKGEKLGIPKRAVQERLTKWSKKGAITCVMRGIYTNNTLKIRNKKFRKHRRRIIRIFRAKYPQKR